MNFVVIYIHSVSMKKFLPVIIFFLIGISSAKAQLFYETEWKAGGVTYKGFMIYYDDNDAVMRVNFKPNANSSSVVAEYKAFGSKFDENNISGYLLDGKDAKIVRGYSKYGYNADNFIFYLEQGQYSNPYAIDDYDLTQQTHSPIEVEFWKQITSEKFTTTFLSQFYTTSEKKYQELIALRNRNNKTHENDKYRVTSFAYGNGTWATVMSKGAEYSEQCWNTTSSTVPKDWILSKWDDGNQITHIDHGNGKWNVTMSKGTGWGLQSYKTDYTYPKEWIKQKWDLGYSITSSCYGNGVWFVVMTKNSGYGLQEWRTSPNYPKEWIDERWNLGYSITSSKFGDGLWAIVMTKGLSIDYQYYNNTYEFPSAWIAQKEAENFYVTSIEYGQGVWNVITSRNCNLTAQKYKTSISYPAYWVESVSGEKNNVSTTSTNTYTTTSNTTPNKTQNTTTNTNSNTTTSSPAKIHLITVANTMIPDIGTSCDVDKTNIINEFEVISHELKMKLVKTTIDGKNLTKANVTTALDDLKPGPNDVVVFFYSGHGFRWKDQTSSYPSIDLRYSNYQSVSQDNSYYLSNIYNVIIKKGARLNIVIGDCCNTSIGITSRNGDFSLSSRSQEQGKVEKLKKLFLKSKGNLLIAAAKPNQTSCGNSRSGGYLISSLFASITKETSYLNSTTPSWESVVTRAISTAKYKTQNLNGCGEQNGIYYSSVK